MAPFPGDEHRQLLMLMAERLSLPAPAFVRHFEMTAAEAMSGRLPTVARHVEHVATLIAASVDEAALARSVALHESTSRRWLEPREGATDALSALRRRAVRVGLVSNCSAEVPRLWPTTPLAPLVDETLFSCEEGLLKPDVEIFERAVRRLGIHPADAVYISDGPLDELEAAASLGVTPVLFESPDLSAERLQGRAWHGRTIASFSELADVMAAS